MKKRMIAIAMVLILAIGMLPAAVYADDVVVIAGGQWGDDISWSISNELVLSVSGQGALGGEGFGEIPWMPWATMFSRIIIEEGITSIAPSLFDNEPALLAVSLPKSLASIGENAFLGSYQLADIYYGGQQEDWDKLTIGTGNDYLQGPSVHFGAEGCEKGHTEVILPGDPPSATMIGYTERIICGVCGFVIKEREIILPLGPNPPVEQPPEMNFTDVNLPAYYFSAVLWATSKGITSGTSETTFSPDSTCTRAQVVTFLWRASGSPEPVSSENPFVDVAEDQYYYKPVLWAVEKGITSGTSETTFSPDAGCTRAQVVTFLYRHQGMPEPEPIYEEFYDVPEDSYYAPAVRWAVGARVTMGSGDGTFSPDNDCTRGQIVTFLYRAIAGGY